MADEELREDDVDEDEEDGGEGEERNGARGGGRGLVETLMTQLGEHREVLGPVATSAAAAAATFAAKKLPELFDRLEQDGGDKLRGRLGEASKAGGVKGFLSGAASRAFSGSGGSLIDRLKQGGQDEAE